MAWNDGRERKKFEAQQERLKKIYLENGMSEEQIQALYEFDKKEFKSRRIYAMRTQRFDFEAFDGEADEGQNPLYDKFLEALSVTDEYVSEERFGWIEEIENPKLAKAMKKLGVDEKELLTEWLVENLTQEQMAKNFKVRQGTISKRIDALKKFFKEFL